MTLIIPTFCERENFREGSGKKSREIKWWPPAHPLPEPRRATSKVPSALEMAKNRRRRKSLVRRHCSPLRCAARAHWRCSRSFTNLRSRLRPRKRRERFVETGWTNTLHRLVCLVSLVAQQAFLTGLFGSEKETLTEAVGSFNHVLLKRKQDVKTCTAKCADLQQQMVQAMKSGEDITEINQRLIQQVAIMAEHEKQIENIEQNETKRAVKYCKQRV
jgi:hypothetical protein